MMRKTQPRAAAVLVLMAAAAAALAVDCPFAAWCVRQNGLDCFEEPLRIAESFGHGLGALVILAAIWLLDPRRRRALARVATGSLGAGLAANVVKMLLARQRPRNFDFTGGVWETFGPWLPMTGAGSGGQSFPSAHAATAVGLAVMLAWLYPRGRWLFAVLAALVACQRLQVGAHYLSDVLFGAAVGLAVSAMCLAPGPVARRFDRLESRGREQS